MDKEVENAVELGVALIGISVVITIIVVTVMLGRGISADTFNWFARANTQVSEGTLSSIAELDTVLPSAGAYNILKEYTSIIESTTCRIPGCMQVTDGLNKEPCIATHLKGKVSLEVHKQKSGFYTVKVHKDTCNWYLGTCTC